MRFVRLSVFVLFILLSATCERPRTRETIFYALIYQARGPDLVPGYYRGVDAIDYDGFAEVPQVELGGEQIPLTYFSPLQMSYQSWDSFPIDTSHELRVDHFWGEAHSRINIPGNLMTTRPRSDFVMGQNESLTVNWTRAHGARYYWLDLYFEYEYYDTTGEWDAMDLDLEVITTDTFHTFSAAELFPPIVYRVDCGEGNIVLWAQDGPKLLPGDKGDIKGRGYGFYYSANEPPEVYFTIVSPPARHQDPEALRRRCRAKFLSRMRQDAGVSDTLPKPSFFTE